LKPFHLANSAGLRKIIAQSQAIAKRSWSFVKALSLKEFPSEARGSLHQLEQISPEENWSTRHEGRETVTGNVESHLYRTSPIVKQ
jgi:hypothetical protein